MSGDPYKHPKWQKKRLRILDRDGFRCRGCGDNESTLHVHHYYYDGAPWDVPDGSLQTLCEKCHTRLGKHPKGGLWVTGEQRVFVAWCPCCNSESFSDGWVCNGCGWTPAAVQFDEVQFSEACVLSSPTKGRKNMKTADVSTNDNIRRDLEKVGLAYTAMAVLVASIDTESNEFQTRKHQWHADAVERYTLAAQNGDCFPEMLLARRPGNRELVPVCGRHRTKAYAASGFHSVKSALVVVIGSKTDLEKLLVVSRIDNLRNGVPNEMEWHYESIACECLATARPGFLPKKEAIDAIATRYGLHQNQKQRVKKHMRAAAFRQKCAALNILKIPESVELCANAYEFADVEGFADIVKTICANQGHKQITKVVRECRQQKMSGADACNYIRDNSTGYRTCGEKMTAVAKVRIDCRKLVTSAEKLRDEPAVDPEELDGLKTVVSGAVVAVTEAVRAAEGRVSR